MLNRIRWRFRWQVSLHTGVDLCEELKRGDNAQRSKIVIDTGPQFWVVSKAMDLPPSSPDNLSLVFGSAPLVWSFRRSAAPLLIFINHLCRRGVRHWPSIKTHLSRPYRLDRPLRARSRRRPTGRPVQSGVTGGWLARLQISSRYSSNSIVAIADDSNMLTCRYQPQTGVTKLRTPHLSRLRNRRVTIITCGQASTRTYVQAQ